MSLTPELSSLIATLDDLIARVESSAKAAQADVGGSALAADLFAAETLLRNSRRRMEKAIRSLG